MYFQGGFAGLNIPHEYQGNPDYVDPNTAFQGDEGGTELLGRLTRQQWNDWVARFSPYIDKLADIATDEGAPQASAERAAATVGSSFDSARAGLTLQESRQGTTLDADESRARNRSFALAEAGAKSDAANRTRAATVERQQSILAGGAGLTNLPDDPQQGA